MSMRAYENHEEELKQKRINGIYQDLFKLTAETEFRGNGNRINGGESVLSIEMFVSKNLVRIILG